MKVRRTVPDAGAFLYIFKLLGVRVLLKGSRRFATDSHVADLSAISLQRAHTWSFRARQM